MDRISSAYYAPYTIDVYCCAPAGFSVKGATKRQMNFHLSTSSPGQPGGVTSGLAYKCTSWYHSGHTTPVRYTNIYRIFISVSHPPPRHEALENASHNQLTVNREKDGSVCVCLCAHTKRENALLQRRPSHVVFVSARKPPNLTTAGWGEVPCVRIFRCPSLFARPPPSLLPLLPLFSLLVLVQTQV